MWKRSGGFTLIELMITVAIAAILAAIAYPNYVDHMHKTRRLDAIAALLRTAQILERCYTEYNSYKDTRCPAVNNGGTNLAAAYMKSDNEDYTISAATLDTHSFVLFAIPKSGKPQASDPCGTLTYEHTGRKGTKADVDKDGLDGFGSDADPDDVEACW